VFRIAFLAAAAGLALSSAASAQFGGYEAGYEWARRYGISDSSDCPGYSRSFVEGCEAYLEDHPNRGSDEDEDSNESDD
jgi:hypothetical protein